MRCIIFVFLWGTLWGGTLEEKIEQVIQKADPTALVGVEVYSKQKHRLIYERNGRCRFVPASCIKAVVAAAALDRLGADYRFETQIKQQGDSSFLVGSGDPSLSFRDLEELILQIEGKEVVIDTSIYEPPFMGPGWMWDEEPAYWCVPMSGLNLEHNFVEGVVMDPPQEFTQVIVAGMLERKRMRVPVRLGKAEKGSTVVGVHSSEKLSELLKVMLSKSDNLYANCIFRKLGGSWERSSVAVGEFLKDSVGIDPGEFKIVDGSGESRYNLMTPHQMVEVLKKMQECRVFREALSVAGIEGTLKHRMQKLCLQGKTGTMTGVTALCGYLVTEKGEELVVTIFVNGYVKSGKEIREELVDEICGVLSRSSGA